MSIKSKQVRVGDYVEIIPGIFDNQLPGDGRRDGLVVELVGKRKDQIVIMFHNGAFLKFHKSQVNHLVKLEGF